MLCGIENMANITAIATTTAHLFHFFFPVTTATSNAIAEVCISPNLAEDVKDNAEVKLVSSHTANLAFNPMAFAFVTRPLATPSGVESYVTSYNGITLRVVKGYDMKYKKDIISMDVLYGYKTMYPSLAVRVLG